MYIYVGLLLSLVAEDDCLVFELRPISNKLACGRSDPLGICSNADNCCTEKCLEWLPSVVGHVHADILDGAALLRLTWPSSTVHAI